MDYNCIQEVMSTEKACLTAKDIAEYFKSFSRHF